MVYFKDKSSPSGEHHLIILDDQHQSVEKGTILKVYTPLIGGRNVSLWPRLTNSFYLDEWSQEVSLSKSIKAWTLRATHHELPRHQQSNGLAPLRTLGHSIIEDVLSRCGKRLRLINVYDAVYASLFTYDHNFDIIKAFCEAWCPFANTLLTFAGELSISLWDLHDLAGLPVTGCLYDEVVPSALELTGADEKGGNLKEEVYLAAYLACWLCTFVLSGKDVNSIRPSTFKMASMMTNSRRVSLAILVLASIYEGGAKYYDPQARKRIHKAEFVSWACNMIVKNRPFKFVDNADAEELDHNFFVAIRLSYLTLRQGDKFIIEPYSPHRFGRQFGYFQDVPGTLKYDTRATSLEEGLRYWRLCILSKSSSKAWLPGLPTKAKKFCSEAYKAWWAKVNGTFLDDNIACLISPKLPKIILKRKRHEDNQVDGGENNPSPVPVPPIVVKSNSQAEVVEKGKGFSHNLADSDSRKKDRH
ncbi:UNVERIFIED_CONTAM: hypothetical protein Sradi_5756700 [Sesamum radiatum]|uniref:Aminotransferase-like plant mobile domain-containing protein n=1 Tax=Sesamum radiatum TaxID=300843 RepID=A0AAW2L2P6_SESRA